MTVEMKHKLSTKQILLLVSLIVFLSSLLITKVYFSKVLASEQIVSGSGFNLYFTSGSELNFQHIKFQYAGGRSEFVTFVARVLVDSGTMNGTNGFISMTEDSGKLTFTSQDIATLRPINATIIVNNKRFTGPTQIQNGDKVTIQWRAVWPIFEPIVPIMFIIGMAGLFAMFIGPAYCIQQIKKRNYWEAAVHGFTITAIGVALFIAWLWV